MQLFRLPVSRKRAIEAAGRAFAAVVTFILRCPLTVFAGTDSVIYNLSGREMIQINKRDCV